MSEPRTKAGRGVHQTMHGYKKKPCRDDDILDNAILAIEAEASFAPHDCVAMGAELERCAGASPIDVERLAALEHEQWIEWASDLLVMEPGISDERRVRWQRLIVTPYANLTAAEKHQDRIYAEKVAATAYAADREAAEWATDTASTE